MKYIFHVKKKNKKTKPIGSDRHTGHDRCTDTCSSTETAKTTGASSFPRHDVGAFERDPKTHDGRTNGSTRNRMRIRRADVGRVRRGGRIDQSGKRFRTGRVPSAALYTRAYTTGTRQPFVVRTLAGRVPACGVTIACTHIVKTDLQESRVGIRIRVIRVRVCYLRACIISTRCGGTKTIKTIKPRRTTLVRVYSVLSIMYT